MSCEQEVARWRECGRRGCERLFAYCEEHGGDGRAIKECVEHVAREHEAKA